MLLILSLVLGENIPVDPVEPSVETLTDGIEELTDGSETLTDGTP